MTSYIVFRILVALLIAAVVYMADTRLGAGLYRWWYSMTHEHPLPTGKECGFIFNRNTGARVVVGTILSSIITLLACMDGEFNALAELVLWLVSIPVIVGTFMAGRRFDGLWSGRTKVFTAVDKWERGEIDLSDELKNKSAEVAARVKQTVAAKRAEPEAVDAAAAPPPATAEPEPDPQELVDRFLKRG